MKIEDLKQLPKGHGLTCYRCKSRPAVMGKQMTTPNGSKYWRGWCQPCLDGKPYKQLERVAPVPEPNNGPSMPFKVGQKVRVAFEGIVLSSAIGKKARTHMHVRAGTMIYVVPNEFVEVT